MRLSRLLVFVVISLVTGVLGFSRPTQAATTKITITPSTATVASGHSTSFSVQAIDNNNVVTDVTADSTLSTNDPKGSTTGAIYTGGVVGSWTVQASYQSFLASATVTVTPGDVAEIVVNPNSEPEIVVSGTHKQFSAQAYDKNSNVVHQVSFAWSVIGPIGGIDSNGVFTPNGLGAGTIQAMAGTVAGQATVTVQAAPVTNTNSKANVNAATNTNQSSTNKNSNTSTNKNVNTVINANTNTVPTTVTNTNTSPASTSSTQCSTLKPWVWTTILVIFLLLVAILYGLVPVTKIWPVVVSLVGAAILAYIQRTYDCQLHSWWAWVITLGTIALSALAIRSNPMAPKK